LPFGCDSSTHFISHLKKFSSHQGEQHLLARVVLRSFCKQSVGQGRKT
jgi:hypothetical protein